MNPPRYKIIAESHPAFGVVVVWDEEAYCFMPEDEEHKGICGGISSKQVMQCPNMFEPIGEIQTEFGLTEERTVNK